MAKNALTITEYLHNKNKRQNAYYISGNIKRYYIDGRYYSQDELDKEFPIHLKILTSEEARNYKGENLDRRKIGK